MAETVEVCGVELTSQRKGELAMLLLYPWLQLLGVNRLDETGLRQLASNLATVYNVKEKELFSFFSFAKKMLQDGWGRHALLRAAQSP